MKKVKTTIVSIALLLCCSFTIFAQGDASSYHAYLNGNIKDVWIKEVNEKTKLAKGDKRSQFTLALSQFGLLSATMADQDEDLFDEHYDKAVDNLEALIKSDKNWAEPKALLSATYGLKMAYSPMMGMFLGPKSGSLIEKAKDQSPNSALVWKVYANSKFFTPEMFGGDLDEAIDSYVKCITLYESKPEQLQHNWLYLDALAFLGQAYLKKEDKAKARNVFEKALKAEPEFAWVKFSLLAKSL
ncbi:MAG: tetratricopeptide repeat protein [Cyclobacteriaceae bacterium]